MLVPDVPKAADPDRLSRMVTDDERAAMMRPFTQPTIEGRVPRRHRSRHRLGDRVASPSPPSAAGGRLRRHRAARRSRLPDRRVPLAVDQPPRRRLGRRRRRPGPAALRGHPGRPGPSRPRLPAVDPHQRGRAPQDRRRDLRRPARGHRSGRRRGHRRGARHRLRSTDVATGPTDSYAPHTVGSLSDYAAAVRAAGRRCRSSPSGASSPTRPSGVIADGQGRLRGHGPQAARRSRPARTSWPTGGPTTSAPASTSTAASATSS